MADWLECALTVVGDKNPLALFKKRARGFPQSYLGDEPPKMEALSFNKLYSVPSYLQDAPYNEDSYHWEIKHWGCKWGPRDTKISEETEAFITYQLVVPGLPIKWLKKVSKDYPNLVFYLDLIEEMEQVIAEDGLLLYR